jgi:hypothetical protein
MVKPHSFELLFIWSCKICTIHGKLSVELYKSHTKVIKQIYAILIKETKIVIEKSINKSHNITIIINEEKSYKNFHANRYKM